MQDKLLVIEKRYQELEQYLSEPGVMEQREKWLQMTREMAAITPLVELFRRMKLIHLEVADAEELIQQADDPEMIDYLRSEHDTLRDELEKIESELKEQLIPKDPYEQLFYAIIAAC